MAGNTDDTVILSPRRRGRRTPWIAAALVALAAVGGAAAWRFLPATTSPVATVADPFRTLDEAAIVADVPATRTVFRFAPNPAILVVDFPTMAEQGHMLNRVAVLVEKSDVPHDRVLDDGELAAVVAASGATSATFYYGHDYRAADVARFFALADRDHVALNPDEQNLRALAAQAAAAPPGFGAVISLPRADAANQTDMTARATILHHELSHGEYFTDPAYARLTETVWRSVLSADERAKVRAYLGAEGYDTGLEDLMMNEMQAYLMHTADPRFFDPMRLGISSARLTEIRAAFAAGNPPVWLRNSGNAARPASPRLPAQRRPAQRGCVSRTIASAARVPPRRRRSSIAA